MDEDVNIPMSEHAPDEFGSSSRKRPAARGTAAYPRKRAITACQTCRARRTKCDNLKPKCSFCQKTGAACVQSPADLSSFDPASLHIIQRIDQLQAEVRSALSVVTPANDAAGASSSATDPSHLLSNHPVSLHDLLLVAPGPERLLEFSHIQEPCRSMVSILKSQPSISIPRPWIAVEADLDLAVCRRLLESFFNFVHVKNPILQEDATRRLVNQVALDGIDWSPHSCLVLLICALGSIATPFGDSESVAPTTLSYATSQAYFQAAQKRIGGCLMNGDVVGAQCLFLAGVYLMCVFRPLDAWRLFSQSLACCQQFEFSEAASIPTSPWLMDRDLDERVAEQAIYWSAWKSEQEVRQVLDLRDFSAIRSSQESLYPNFFPTPPTPSAAVDRTLHETQYDRERMAWYFYLTEISLRRLRQRIMDEMLKFESRPGQSVCDGLAQLLPDWEAEIAEWVDALPYNMSLKSDPTQDDVCKFVLRGHLHDLYDAIHWPFLSSHIFDAQQAHTDCVSITYTDVSDHLLLHTLAEKSLSLHVERIFINKPGFKHRHHGTWPLVWSCSRSASILLKIALMNKEAGKTLTMPIDWKEAVREVIDLNRYWQIEASDSRYRLPILEHAMMLVDNDALQ